MKLNFYFLLLLPLLVRPQPKSNTAVAGSFEKWEKAIVNLECRGFEQPFLKSSKIYQEIKARDTLNIFKNDSLFLAVTQKKHLVTGTALYVKDGDRKYLITAKHVVFDRVRMLQDQFQFHDSLHKSVKDFEALYEISIRTPYSVYLKRKRNNAVGWTSSQAIPHPYVLSSDKEDIAVISLQSAGFEALTKTLDEDGYEPLDVSIFEGIENAGLGDEVFTIGYPFYSTIGSLDISRDSAYSFQSPDYVLPILTYGRISMSHPKLNYVIADIDAYPGNSGGPLIFNDKVIGLVSSQMPLQTLTANNASDTLKDLTKQIWSRGNLVKVVKTAVVMQYIRQLQKQERDKSFL